MPRKLYIECRLFNVNDRLATLHLCEQIDSWVDLGLLTDFDYCYLPYRDSNNQVPPDAPDIGQAIFDFDIEALSNCAGVVGFFDGPEYDSGCGFEIGLAYAWGYPINLITTDFYKWSVGGSSDFYYASKLLQYVSSTVAIPDADTSISGYRQQQEDLRERAISQLRINLINTYNQSAAPVPVEPLPVVYDYYLDPNFKYTEPGRNLLAAVTDAIETAGKTYIIGDNQGDISADLDNLRQSGQPVFFCEPFDPNVDSDILHGFAYGIGQSPIVYSSNMQRYTDGASVGQRNVMIKYSAEAVVSSLAELVALL